MIEREGLMAQVERCLDGDLDRRERLHLFEDLAAAPDASNLAAEAVALQRGLAAVRAAYGRAEPSVAFAAAALPPFAVRSRQSRPAFPRRNAMELFRHPIVRHSWSGLAGAALTAAVLLLVVLPARDVKLADRLPVADRVQVLDVPFQNAADTREWSHSVHLDPGQSARLLVHQDHHGAFHLRVACGGDVDVTLVHSRPHVADERNHIQGGHVHYATLPAPQDGDTLVVKNQGMTGIDIHVAAPSKGAATLDRRSDL